MRTPMSPERMADIRAALDRYRGHAPVGFACCSAHGPADAVPDLLAEVERLQVGISHVPVTRVDSERLERYTTAIKREVDLPPTTFYLVRKAVMDVADAELDRESLEWVKTARKLLDEIAQLRGELEATVDNLNCSDRDGTRQEQILGWHQLRSPSEEERRGRQ